MCTIEILPDLTFGSVHKISRYEIMCTKINTWIHSISKFSWKIAVKPLQNVSLSGESSVILVLYTVNSLSSRRHLWDLHFVSILGRFPFVRTDRPVHRWSCYFDNEIGFSQEFFLKTHLFRA